MGERVGGEERRFARQASEEWYGYATRIRRSRKTSDADETSQLFQTACFCFKRITQLMSERGNFRGRGGGGGSRGGGDHRGGRGGGRGGAQGGQAEKPKKENILDLAKYMDKQINVKFNGGREGRSSPFFYKIYGS